MRTRQGATAESLGGGYDSLKCGLLSTLWGARETLPECAAPHLVRALRRSYKERLRHLCKVTEAFLPRAQGRSRYERFPPLAMGATEGAPCARVGVDVGGFAPSLGGLPRHPDGEAIP